MIRLYETHRAAAEAVPMERELQARLAAAVLAGVQAGVPT